jgi:hypothetical protein
MRARINRFLYKQLPAYANGSLPRPLRWLVRLWLNARPDATESIGGLLHVKEALADENTQLPSAAAWNAIQVRIRTQTAPSPSPYMPRLRLWGLTALLLAISTAFLWNILPPGIVLEWSFDGYTPDVFRVYRAEENSNGNPQALSYDFIEQVPAKADLQAYRFTDLRLQPGQTYVYRVEAVGPNGFLLARDFVSANALEALPGQAAILFAGIGFILALILLFRQVNRNQRGLLGGGLVLR